MAFPRTPLKYVTTYNDEVLPESFDPDRLINYIEISDVDALVGITGTTTVRFSEAPSRARRVIRTDDVLISTVRTYLRAIASADRDHDGFIASTGFCILRPSKVHPGFLKFAASNPEFVEEVIARSTGISYPAINASDLVRLSIPAPSWTKQKSITKFLDRETAQIDELIGKQKRLVELLAEKRQAIITHAVTKGLDPTAPTKPSRTPWLNGAPDHWTKVKLSWAFKFLNGDRGSNYPSRDEFQSDGVPFINAGHISDGRIDMSTMNYISHEKYEALGGAKLRAGDVLYCLRGSLGKHALLTGLQEGALASSLVALRALHLAWVSPAYLALLFKSPAAETQLAIIASGSAQPNMSVENLQSFSFPIPPLKEQQLILDYVNKKCDRLNTIQATARTMILRLQERRSAIISAAVTGKIDVREGAL